LTAKTRGISRTADPSESDGRHSDQLSQSLVKYCRIKYGLLQPRETAVSPKNPLEIDSDARLLEVSSQIKR
jgi:hypothetical protein